MRTFALIEAKNAASESPKKVWAILHPPHFKTFGDDGNAYMELKI